MPRGARPAKRGARPPAGAARYDAIGVTYAQRRRPDPSWQRAIAAALAGAARVVNVGAGSGNYEPLDAAVVAIEPSSTMLAQRAHGAAPAIQGVAEHLAVRDGAFDAALAILTVHHWTDPAAGLAELARVAARQVVVTWDKALSAQFWLARDYLPAIVAHEATLPGLDYVIDRLSVDEVVALPVPRGCVDGFFGAMWEAPSRYLDPAVRAGMSGLSLLDQRVVDDAMRALGDDLDSGRWAERNGALDDEAELDVGYRLIVAHGTTAAVTASS